MNIDILNWLVYFSMLIQQYGVTKGKKKSEPEQSTKGTESTWEYDYTQQPTDKVFLVLSDVKYCMILIHA